MFYTGINPLDMKPVYVATDYHEKQLQRALLQYNRPQNAPLVREALIKLHREDLIGFGAECLVRPEQAKAPQRQTKDKQFKDKTGKDKQFKNASGKDKQQKDKKPTHSQSKNERKAPAQKPRSFKKHK
jgi:hypothetical protein